MAREKIFRFKQFSVKNDKSAMKVGTDGVLLGAWTEIGTAQKILDVGTGTGLIALMLAQRSTANIDAVEIDEIAAQEAMLNFENSPWTDRLSLEVCDFIDYSRICDKKFDLIVSNPPYFENSMKNPDNRRTQARHTETLTYEGLIEGIKKLLSENGRVALITPSDVEQKINNLIEDNSLFLIKKTYVCPVEGGDIKRIMWEFSKIYAELKINTIAIEKERHVYTKEYIELTKDFYLKM